MSYNAFISYSHADCGGIAPAIQKALENIGKPWYRLKRNLTVFRDETNLAASPELWGSIATALDNADNIILLASPVAKDSYWINREIVYWFEKKNRANLYIILVQGNIEWDGVANDFDRTKTNCLPQAVFGKYTGEPLWIDLKNYYDIEQKSINYKHAGFTSGLTRIIGGILGKTPREIESAELKSNRNKKTFLAFIFSLLLALTVFAFVQMTEAKIQKNAAVKERVKAVKAEREAIENLQKFKTEEFEKNLKNGSAFFEAKEPALAAAFLIKADSTAKDSLFNQNISTQKKRYIDSVLKKINNKTDW